MLYILYDACWILLVNILCKWRFRPGQWLETPFERRMPDVRRGPGGPERTGGPSKISRRCSPLVTISLLSREQRNKRWKNLETCHRWWPATGPWAVEIAPSLQKARWIKMASFSQITCESVIPWPSKTWDTLPGSFKWVHSYVSAIKANQQGTGHPRISWLYNVTW